LLPADCSLPLPVAVMVVIGASVRVRNSIDDFIADLHRQGWWLLWGAAFTVIASVLTLIAHLWPLLLRVSAP
jgi:hypothetical protein